VASGVVSGASLPSSPASGSVVSVVSCVVQSRKLLVGCPPLADGGTSTHWPKAGAKASSAFSAWAAVGYLRLLERCNSRAVMQPPYP
jgi:hypothetical protein